MLAVNGCGLAGLRVGGHSLTKQGMDAPQALLAKTQLDVTLEGAMVVLVDVHCGKGSWLRAILRRKIPSTHYSPMNDDTLVNR